MPLAKPCEYPFIMYLLFRFDILVIVDALAVPSPKRTAQITAFVDRDADQPAFEVFLVLGDLLCEQDQTDLLQDIVRVGGIVKIMQSDAVDHIRVSSEDGFSLFGTDFLTHFHAPCFLKFINR